VLNNELQQHSGVILFFEAGHFVCIIFIYYVISPLLLSLSVCAQFNDTKLVSMMMKSQRSLISEPTAEWSACARFAGDCVKRGWGDNLFPVLKFLVFGSAQTLR
jgi:hypothetical protein